MPSPKRSTASTRLRSSIDEAHGATSRPSSSQPSSGWTGSTIAGSGAHRLHPAGRSRGTLIRHAERQSHGRVTQTIWPPAKPERFSFRRRKGYGEDRRTTPKSL